MRAAGDDADAVRLRGLIVVLWRAGHGHAVEMCREGCPASVARLGQDSAGVLAANRLRPGLA